MAVVPWPQEQKDNFVRSQFSLQRSHYKEHYAESQFDIVMLDEVAAGRLYVHRGQSEIRIIDISLLPQFRGQGVGRRLLEQGSVVPLRPHAFDCTKLPGTQGSPWNAPELPLVALGESLVRPSAQVAIEDLA